MHIKKYPELTDNIKTAYKLVYDKKSTTKHEIAMQFGGKPIEISPNRMCIIALTMPIDHIESFNECNVFITWWNRCWLFSTRTSC